MSKIDVFVDAILKEIDVKKIFLEEDIESIYLGGGTPSVLQYNQLKRIVDKIYSSFNISNNVEFTIEINPEDISEEYYSMIKDIGFNRLSIGIQSFNDKISEFLNRRHNSQTAHNAIDLAYKSGFDNISIDLIYGIPNQTIDDFILDLDIVKKNKITHLSAYHLGIEPNTYFGKLKRLNKIQEIDESVSEDFFYKLSHWAKENKYEHYELSSFAYNNKYSLHNKNYWFHVPYLSFGPSAHSFVNNVRHYNISNLTKYINALLADKEFFQHEELTDYESFNEYIMLRLRTKWGICINELKNKFDPKHVKHFIRVLNKFKTSDYIITENDNIRLTAKGFFASDYIFREFFIS